MFLKDESMYMSGLTNMASSASDFIGPSYVEADCFDDKNYVQDFAEVYEVDEQLVDLVQYEGNLEGLFKSLFGENNPNIIEGLVHWIGIRAGKCRKILTVKEDNKLLEALSDGLGPFYFVEDIYFVEFEKMVICFMLGNDE